MYIELKIENLANDASKMILKWENISRPIIAIAVELILTNIVVLLCSW